MYNGHRERMHPKARSYDTGVDTLGFEKKSPGNIKM